jgi:hypothetical protein
VTNFGLRTYADILGSGASADTHKLDAALQALAAERASSASLGGEPCTAFAVTIMYILCRVLQHLRTCKKATNMLCCERLHAGVTPEANSRPSSGGTSDATTAAVDAAGGVLPIPLLNHCSRLDIWDQVSLWLIGHPACSTN